MLIEKEQKGKKREEKAMRKRIFAAFVCLCMLMALVPSMAYANDTVYTGGLCEHHTQHDDACGYSEGTAEVPCSHEHTEDCYTLVTNCVHEHTAECYSEGSTEPDLCGHVCSEESGCITKELNCNHEHDENCGYVPAKEGTPCTYVCEICNAQAAEEPECICDTKCTEEEVNADCPVCGGENGDISGCVGAAMMLAPIGAGVIEPTKPEGNGTEENPYQIGTVDELYWFAGLVNGTLTDGTAQNRAAHAKLMDDIVIQTDVLDTDGNLINGGSGLEEWTPIGSYDIDGEKAYTGTFDGQNHTISGLYVNIIDSDDPEKSVHAGLFGCVGSGGNIQNVGVEDSYIRVVLQNTAYDHVGGVCGSNEGTITNCYNTGTVSSSDSVGGVCGGNAGTIIECHNTGTVSGGNVGGMCGENYDTITNCYNTGTVSGGNVGGVCGVNYNGTITNCYNKGIVSGSDYVGGVCGWNKPPKSTIESTIINCYNIGTVSGTKVGGVCGLNEGTITECNNRGEVSGSDSVGGVCWKNSGTITNCYNTGTVSGTNNAGGVCGDNEGTITNCYNTGTVRGTYAGGVCGDNEDTITNCYNTGEVSGSTNTGGVCRRNEGTIANCYNTGTVSAPHNVDGMCWENPGTIINCYLHINISGGWATHKTDSQFKSGEVAWLLNGSQNPQPWGQGSNGIPVLKDNLPEDVTCTTPVRVTIQMPDGAADQYIYTTAGSVLPMSAYPEGYAFYGEQNYQSLINIGEKTYNNDTTIYAKNADETTGITLNPTTLSLDINDTEILTATVMPNTASQVLKWESSDDTVATVDQNGKVTAVAGGTATITATAFDRSDVYGQCQVNVKQLVTGIQLTDMQINVGETKKIEAKILPDNASEKTLTWSSNDPSVATVDSNGNVTGKSKGTVKITARTTDGTNLEAECTVTVKKKSSGGSVFFWDLKFDTNGGSKIDTVTEWEYSTIDLDEYVPEKEGYKFAGWYADKDLDKKIDEVYLTQDTTVYAKWEKIAEEVPEEPDETEEIKETETISFKDVKERDWFYEAVSYAVENGLMSGMSEDIFAPNTPLTREMLAVVLYNVEGQPESTEANTFTDVKGDMWYTDAILWANENGIVAGYDNGAYGVGDLITREQFATILYRYAQFKGYDTTQGGMAVREISDYENISDYARPAMAWAVNAGIMGGMDDGTLMPQGKATRAEAATMLMNFCENIVK